MSRSICPYCGVGCGQLIFHRDGKILSIEGDPESPVSRGHLCPKGAASFELVTHPGRMKTVKYRAPRSLPYSSGFGPPGFFRIASMSASVSW